MFNLKMKHWIFVSWLREGKLSLTSSKASNISMLGWWIVQTTVRPVSTVFLTVLITIAAALASRPEVGSSMNIIDGLATSSTAIVNLFLCSVDKPFTPGNPTKASLSEVSSTSCITSSMNICYQSIGSVSNWNGFIGHLEEATVLQCYNVICCVL